MLGSPECVMMPAKIVLTDRARDKDMTQICIFGAAVSLFGSLLLPVNSGMYEMWECEILIRPRRKYSGRKTGEKTYCYAGRRFDQILVDGYERPEMWGDKYFDIDAEKPQ